MMPSHPVMQQYIWRSLFPISGRMHKPGPDRTVRQQDVRPPIPVSIRNIHRYPSSRLRPRHTKRLEFQLSPVFQINKALFWLTLIISEISDSSNIQVPISIEVPGYSTVTAVDRKEIAPRKMHTAVVHIYVRAVIRL